MINVEIPVELNAFIPILSSLELGSISTFVSFEQHENAFDSMILILFGILTVVMSRFPITITSYSSFVSSLFPTTI